MWGQVEEECGFRVAPDALQLVTGYRASVGTSGSHHTLFFAEVRILASTHVNVPYAGFYASSVSIVDMSSRRLAPQMSETGFRWGSRMGELASGPLTAITISHQSQHLPCLAAFFLSSSLCPVRSSFLCSSLFLVCSSFLLLFRLAMMPC